MPASWFLRSLSCCTLSPRAGARGVEVRDVVLDILLLARQGFGLALRVLDVAPARADCDCCELPLGFPQLIDGAGGLRGRGVRIAVGRRLAHRVGGLLQPARGSAASSGRFSSRASFSSWRAASSAWSASARCASPPPWPWPAAARARAALGLLLLAPRELLQLLGELVDLLIGLLLRRALRRLVLVGHLVDFELEQVGELVGHLVCRRLRRRHPAAAAR